MTTFRVVSNVTENSSTLWTGNRHAGADTAVFGRDISVFVRAYDDNGEDVFNIFASTVGSTEPPVYIGKITAGFDQRPVFIDCRTTEPKPVRGGDRVTPLPARKKDATKLYLLVNKNVGYDENYSMVVLANSEQEARRIANANRSHEGPIWLDANKATCELVDTSKPRSVQAAYLAG